MIHRLSAVFVLLVASAALPVAADFQTGDLYLSTASTPVGRAILRIDPVSGVVTVLNDEENVVGRASTYDPWRDRIISVVIFEGEKLRMIDSSGVATDLIESFDQSVGSLASAGDGRVYLLGSNSLANIGMIDAANQTHTVLDAMGDPLVVDTEGGFGIIFFDAVQNAVFVGHRTGLQTRVRRYLLNEAGDQVLGPDVNVVFDGSTASGDEPIQFSAGPNGSLFVKIDDNSNSAQPRMRLIDPVAMTASTYAVSEYFGVGGEVAGSYSSARDQAVVLDSLADQLRVFNQGASGEGAIFASGVSGGGSGESAILLSIGDTILGGGGPPPNPADINNDGVVDAADLASLLANWGPCPGCPEDLDGDGDVDAADLAILLANWG